MTVKAVSINVHGHRIDLAAYGEKFIGDGDYLYLGDDEDAKIYTSSDHLKIETTSDTKNVRIQSRDYTATSGDVCGIQTKPNMTAASGTVFINAIEVSPRFPDGSLGKGMTGVHVNPILKGSGAAGNISGKIVCFHGKVESASGSTRTVTGPMAILKGTNYMHGTCTNGVYFLEVEAAYGNLAWSGFALLPDDAQVADSDGGSTADGWVKVKIGTQVTYIPTYNTAH